MPISVTGSLSPLCPYVNTGDVVFLPKGQKQHSIISPLPNSWEKGLFSSSHCLSYMKKLPLTSFSQICPLDLCW